MVEVSSDPCAKTLDRWWSSWRPRCCRRPTSASRLLSRICG
ncbi:hypothetical protein E2C01_083368 [Portunus trituberculatus]|uniref:Uncharacterized protein n=1 Tax=Portunus trituberculatus TaxID=210409 RepID=A0A5B7J1T8_PORTR|nr:hypothetical protein [Portunus trituberculatus]